MEDDRNWTYFEYGGNNYRVVIDGVEPGITVQRVGWVDAYIASRLGDGKSPFPDRQGLLDVAIAAVPPAQAHPDPQGDNSGGRDD